MTDLTDRMRTCAAFIKSWNEDDEGAMLLQLSVMLDAADLLIEASNALEAAPAPLGEPVEIIEPSHTSIPPTIDHKPSDLWIAPGGPLPGLTRSGTISPRACPRCDSRANKTVHRRGNHFVLECPVCGHVWERA